MCEFSPYASASRSESHVDRSPVVSDCSPRSEAPDLTGPWSLTACLRPIRTCAGRGNRLGLWPGMAWASRGCEFRSVLGHVPFAGEGKIAVNQIIFVHRCDYGLQLNFWCAIVVWLSLVIYQY